MKRLVYRLAPSLCLFALGGLALDCDNGAIGVEACRSIETKRCDVYRGCENSPVVTESDAKVCELFYRDQCLFGIANDATEPDDTLVNACLSAIDRAAACKGVATIAECDNPPAVGADVDATSTSGCDLIHEPELMEDCAFLRPVPQEEEEEGGAGGTPSTGGMGGTGGAGGAGGSAGGM